MTNPGRPKTAHRRLDDVLTTDPDTGQPVTVAESILGWLREAHQINVAYARAGIPPGTMIHWLRETARLEQLLVLDPDRELDDDETALIQFSRAVDVARAEGEARITDLLTGAATGGHEVTTITRKVEVTGFGDEIELERTVKTERTLPNWAASRWILENRYGRRAPASVDVTVGVRDPLGEGDRAEALQGTIEAWLTKREDDRAITSGG